jgi:hypothetical protein
LLSGRSMLAKIKVFRFTNLQLSISYSWIACKDCPQALLYFTSPSTCICNSHTNSFSSAGPSDSCQPASTYHSCTLPSLSCRSRQYIINSYRVSGALSPHSTSTQRNCKATAPLVTPPQISGLLHSISTMFCVTLQSVLLCAVAFLGVATAAPQYHTNPPPATGPACGASAVSVRKSVLI